MQGRQEAVTGKLPIEVHLRWRHRGGRQESVLSELMKTPEKHKADMSVQGDLPCEKGKCLLHSTLPSRLILVLLEVALVARLAGISSKPEC